MESLFAAGLPDSVAVQFDDFEAGVAQLKEFDDALVVPLLRETGRYLAQFRPSAGNYYHAFLQHVFQPGVNVALATLNHDLLLDHAIEAVGGDTRPILKIHGASNLWPTLSSSFNGCTFENAPAIVTGSRVEATPLSKALLKYDDPMNDCIPPVMAMYAKGKAVLSYPEYVRTVQEGWRHHVEHSDTVYVVGVRFNPSDDHVFEPLRSTTAGVYYVGPDPEDFSRLVKYCGRTNVYHSDNTFEDLCHRLAGTTQPTRR